MLNFVLVIRGIVDDETEAQKVLAYIDEKCDEYEDIEFTTSCKTTQVITNG